MQIFKVQLPIVSNDPDMPALIYNESRSIEYMIRANQVEDLFTGSQKKIYIYAEIINGEFEFHKFAPEQEW